MLRTVADQPTLWEAILPEELRRLPEELARVDAWLDDLCSSLRSLAPVVRMTVTPRAVGVSAGPRGAKLSVHPSGRVRQTFSLPGSGVSHTKTLGPSGRLPRGSAVPTSPSRPSQPAPQVPSWIAPKWEKQLWTVTIRRPSPPDF
jgi:Protein of unknown function (DUF4236)